MTETLRQKQSRFALAVALLIQEADRRGYAVTFGEAYRTPEQAALNAKKGTGSSNSLHMDRLAIDLNLFKGDRYIVDGEGHSELGRWWKALNQDHRWGGDFPKKDFNHYSLTADGKRA